MKKILILGGVAVTAALLYIYYTSSDRYEVVEEEVELPPADDYIESGDLEAGMIRATTVPMPEKYDPGDYEHPEDDTPNPSKHHPVWDPSFVGYILSEYEHTFKSIDDDEAHEDMYIECILENIDNAELWGIARSTFDIPSPLPIINVELSTLIYRLRNAFSDKIYMNDPVIYFGEVLMVIVNLMVFMHEDTSENCLRYLLANGNAFNADPKDTEEYFKAYSLMNTRVPNIFGLESSMNARTLLDQFSVYHEEFIN